MIKESDSPSPWNESFNKQPLGTPERLIHGYWQLGIKRFHILSDECSEELQHTYNLVNHKLGVDVISIDLGSLGNEYRNDSRILQIIRNEVPTWIWFRNCHALLDTSLAGWLRSVLTTYNVDHVRVVFVLDSKDQFRSIFQKYSAPFYQSTMPLELI
ncbi:hypothetical protein [Vibrio rotiferianus]|uniref:hypothetical protein n=1 Tax=Vibrio rotiferianus TaxID=190895 RepID=UPI00249044E8|nr:hypothetical protein [Vibrio rotiferianus]MBE4054630.1 hypothetical protein [Vibrio parahaemolyticus]